jgi:hypothetical protein
VLDILGHVTSLKTEGSLIEKVSVPGVLSSPCKLQLPILLFQHLLFPPASPSKPEVMLSAQEHVDRLWMHFCPQPQCLDQICTVLSVVDLPMFPYLPPPQAALPPLHSTSILEWCSVQESPSDDIVYYKITCWVYYLMCKLAKTGTVEVKVVNTAGMWKISIYLKPSNISRLWCITPVEGSKILRAGNKSQVVIHLPMLLSK